MNKFKIIKSILSIILSIVFFYLSFVFLRILIWIKDVFGKVDFIQILFFLKVPITGTSDIIIKYFNEDVLLYCLFILIFVFLFFILLYIVGKNIKLKFNCFVKNLYKFLLISIWAFIIIFIIDNVCGFFLIEYKNITYIFKVLMLLAFLMLCVDILFEILKLKISNKILFYSIVLFLLSILNFGVYFDVFEDLFLGYSDFYEQNYVNPKTVKIDSPKNKKNLILIYMESMDYSVINNVSKYYELELLDIAKNNQSFDNYLSGIFQNWTQASLLATTTGIPFAYKGDMVSFLKKPLKLLNSNKTKRSFAKNAYSIYQILKDNGYALFFLQGGNLEFAETDIFLKGHGFDDSMIVGAEKIAKYYKQYKRDEHWWGYFDSDVYEILKIKLKELSNNQPFFATMFTLDTHFSKTDKLDVAKEQHKKFVKVASLLLVDFLSWLKNQPFANDTTVVVIGDHDRMGTNFPKANKNNVYNVFINASVKTKNTNRTFNQIDLFPTILESIGFKIEGDRLGLGTSLFSQKQTLIEKFGHNKLKKMLRYKSKLYNSLWVD